MSWRLCFHQRCYLYQAFDEGGSVLYVGISSQPQARIKEHKRKSPWSRVAVRFEIKCVGNRFDAMREERAAIEKHRPPFNLSLNPRYSRSGYKYFEASL